MPKSNKTPPVQASPSLPQRVTIAEARALLHQKKEDVVITWRPEINLPEEKQYCLIS